MSDFSHFDDSGAARMVDVGAKETSQRYARASSRVCMSSTTANRIRKRDVEKGDVLQVARLAGIMAAKRTSELIPLCHPLPLDSVSLSLEFVDASSLTIDAQVRTTARTGVEMEAMVAASVAALTIYDMCKSLDRNMFVDKVQLEEKSGGRSGHFLRS